MTNEIIFLYYIILIVAITQLAYYYGKEALFGWIGFQLVLANLFILKQVDILGLTVTASDAYIIGAFLSLNLVQDRYGKESANQAINISMGLQVAFTYLAGAHLWLHPSASDSAHASYDQILSPMNSIILFSLLILFLTQKFDVWFFGKLKDRFPRLSFEKRSIISMLVTQALDTVLFTLIALRGIVDSPLHVILFSYSIKAILVFTMNRMVAMTKRWVTV